MSVLENWLSPLGGNSQTGGTPWSTSNHARPGQDLGLLDDVFGPRIALALDGLSNTYEKSIRPVATQIPNGLNVAQSILSFLGMEAPFQGLRPTLESAVNTAEGFNNAVNALSDPPPLFSRILNWLV